MPFKGKIDNQEVSALFTYPVDQDIYDVRAELELKVKI